MEKNERSSNPEKKVYENDSTRVSDQFGKPQLQPVSKFMYTTSRLSAHTHTSTVWVKKKIPPTVFWKFFQNGWEFLINFLHTYFAIISTLDYKFLFKYLQLWQSYAILSATT